eukprot:403370052
MALQYLDLNDERDQALISFLNPYDRGSDTIIIHPGSHSIKFGLASQMQPFIIPNVIAYPNKNGKRIKDFEGTQQLDADRQQLFDQQIDRVLPEVEQSLRKKRFYLIDAKSAKNIRNKQVSFKQYDENNCIIEGQELDIPFDSHNMNVMTSELNEELWGEKFRFTSRPDTQDPNTQKRPFFVGKEALTLHKNEEYTLRYPIKYGDFNITNTQNMQDCCQDLQNILEFAFKKYMGLPTKNINYFNCILIIPDMFVRHHVRYMTNMILGKMEFKSIFIHNESIMSSYAMALPSACVVDIGSTKTSVCCIDEGLILPKTLMRKHYGGDDVDQIFYRMLQRQKALHYFPKNMLNMDSVFHRLLIAQIKERFAATEMDPGEIVKIIHLHIKDRIEPKTLKNTKITFNCSDALLFATQSLFYAPMLSINRQILRDTSDPVHGDPMMVVQGFQDPEDIMYDILQTSNNAALQKLQQQQRVGGDDSGGNTPSASVHQDMQSDVGDESDVGDKQFAATSIYQQMDDPIDLDEMICRSICNVENQELRRKMANQIIVVGGTAKTKKFVDSLEEAVMDRFTRSFDETIERVNVEQFNVQQFQQFQQQLIVMQSMGQGQDMTPETLRIDPRFVSWMGASIIPKLETSKDCFITREKYLIDFKPYKENFQEVKLIEIQKTIDQKNEQEEKKEKAEENTMMIDTMTNKIINPEDQNKLTSSEIEAIEKNIAVKLKKERNMEAGVKHIREKAPFHF